MSGKWAHLKGIYPERADLDESQEAKVVAAQEKLVGKSIPELADHFMNHRYNKSVYEDAIAALNVEIEAARRRLLELLEAQGLTNAETTDGEKLSTRVEVYPSITDPEAFNRHLRENPDLDYLRKPHPASLAAYVRGLLEEGKDSELPPGVNVYLKTTVGVKKA